MHKPYEPVKLPTFDRLEPLTIPNIKPVETDSVPKRQSLHEWGMAGGGVPAQYKDREHEWHAKVNKHTVSMKKGGDPLDEFVPPRFRSAGRRPEAHNDRTAAANMPVDFARGAISGALGAPGDIESLVRMIPGLERSQGLGNLVTGEHRETYLPTSEEIEKRLPFRSDTPQGRMAAGLGSLAGGFYTGPGAPINVAAKGAKMVGKGALKALEEAGTGPAAGSRAAQRGVIKMPGGNFLTGRVEKDVKGLKRQTGGGNDPAEMLRQMREKYTPEAIESLPEISRPAVVDSIASLEKDAALNKWVDSNLSGYVKNQMGTPEDPVRLMFDKRTQEIDDKYAKEIKKSERIAQRASEEPDPRKQANLMRDAERIKTEADTERDLAVNHIMHKPSLLDEYPRDAEGVKSERKAAGFPEEGMAQSPMAKAWERASDESLATHRAGDIQEMPARFTKGEEAQAKMVAAREEVDKKFLERIQKAGFNERETANVMSGTPYIEKARLVGDTAFEQANAEYRATQSPMMNSYIALGRENPWISKLDPETQIYSPFTGDLGFDHIMDVLREDLTTGRIRPEQMSKISITDAVRRTSQYDQELAAKMNASRAAAREGLPTYKEYPEGYKWIELNKPGSFAQESEAMGHSVRGYEPPEGHPDWSEGSGDAGSSSYGHGGWEAIKSGKAKVYSLVDPKGAPHATVEVGPAHRDRGFFGDQRPTNEEYYGQMNKYVAGQNNGMVAPNLTFAEWWRANQGIPEPEALPPRISQIKGKSNRAPNEEYLPYVQDFVKSGQWSDVGDLQNTGLIKHPDTGKWVTGASRRQEMLDEIAREAQPPDGMAHGGIVHMQKGGKLGAGLSIAEAVAKASKKADEMLDAKKAAGKLEEAMKANQAPMAAPHGTGLPLMPRSQGMYTPGVKQEDLPRMPKVDKARAEGKQPAYTERMQDLLDSPTARKKVDKLINKGKDLNVQEWYGTEPLRQVAMDAGLSPDEFKTFIAQMASASQRNPVDQQNKMGSYLHYLSKTGQLPDDAFLLTNKIKRGKQEMPQGTPIELPPSYGSLAQGDIFARGKQIASGDIMGALPPDKKLGTFYRNYLGNLKPVTVDVNAVRGPIIERGDPRWLTSKLVEKDEEGNVLATHFPRKDVAEGRMSLKEAKDRPGFWEAAPSGSEYAGFEDLWQRGAKRHGMDPAEAQALGWYGSADVTALKTKPELYIDNLERMIRRTAEETGQHPLQVMDDVIKGKGYLYKEGGAVEKHFDGGGLAATDFAGAEDDGGSLDKAKLMAKILADMAKQQGNKEVDSLSKPRATTDLLNRGLLANNPLSAVVDLVNMGLVPLDVLGSKLTGRDIKVSSDKPFLGSEHVKDLMDKYNVTSGEERPMMEAALSFLSPAAMIKGATKVPGAAKKVADVLTPSKIPPLATEAKTAQAGKPTGATYATRQEGPFYRVSQSSSDKSAGATRGVREADGLQAQGAIGAGPSTTGQRVPKQFSDEEVAGLIASPSNKPLKLAQSYTKEQRGADFMTPELPTSSLAKQSAIGRTHMAAVEGSPAYKDAIFDAYAKSMPDVLEQAGAKSYDDLLEKAYRQLAKETSDQFDRLPVSMSFHKSGEGNYKGAKEMASDVHGNDHLYVFQGGDKHDFLNQVDPRTGLNENEKFRAVHDLFGHAIQGNEFGPLGEERAWGIHKQMYSPLAQLAMTAETRGQNSVVNYTPLNARLKAEVSQLREIQMEAKRRGDTQRYKLATKGIEDAFQGFQYAPQKAILLPPEYLSVDYKGGMPDYVRKLITPEKGTETQSVLTHYSNAPDLKFTDPKRYGTGIKGEEAGRLTDPSAVRDRSYFYMGEPGAISPEPGLGVNRYRGEASSLYDITQDPLDFRVLARESNRTPYTSKYNQGIVKPLQDANDMERLVREYGYQGMANPKASKPMAIMFDQTPVQRHKRGGLSSIK